MKPLLTSVDAVLFDLDGTLVETNIDFPLMKQKMIEMAVEQGLQQRSLDDLDILAIVDTTTAYIQDHNSANNADAIREHAMKILEEIELRHAGNTERIPFANELVTELSCRKIGIGIVTRNCRKASEISLDIVGIKPDILICREDTSKHKPHPEPLFAALDALSASPAASIMVGDHIMDIKSGKAAGMKTIGFLRDYRPDNFFDIAGPDFVARNLREVYDAIIDSDS